VHLCRPFALRLFHHLLQQAPDATQGRIVGTALDGRCEVIGICTLLPIQWQRSLRAGSLCSTSQPIAVAIAAHHDRRGRRVAINRSCGPHPEGFMQRARLQLQAMAGNDTITRCSVDGNGQPLRVCENALGPDALHGQRHRQLDDRHRSSVGAPGLLEMPITQMQRATGWIAVACRPQGAGDGSPGINIGTAFEQGKQVLLEAQGLGLRRLCIGKTAAGNQHQHASADRAREHAGSPAPGQPAIVPVNALKLSTWGSTARTQVSRVSTWWCNRH